MRHSYPAHSFDIEAMRQRLAKYGWMVGVSVALTAVLLVIAPQVSLAQTRSSHHVFGRTHRLVVELPVDVTEDAEPSDTLVVVLGQPGDLSAQTSHFVPVANDDGKPRVPAAFPLATPRRGPPQA